MTTRVDIKNVDGPDIVLINDGRGRVTALLPGEELEMIICQDYTISINEADKLAPPLNIE